MNKSKIYSSVLAAMTTFILWDLIDYFILNLAFPRDLFDRYTFALPMVMLIFIVLLDRESKKAKAAEQATAIGTKGHARDNQGSSGPVHNHGCMVAISVRASATNQRSFMLLVAAPFLIQYDRRWKRSKQRPRKKRLIDWVPITPKRKRG